MQSLSQLSESLKPYLSTSGSSSVTSRSSADNASTHALDSAFHTGQLSDNQAPQFLLLSGQRPMLGSLNLGGNDIANVRLINGIDITNLAASASGRLLEGFAVDITDDGYISSTPTISVDSENLVNGLSGDGLKNVDNAFAIDHGVGLDISGSGQLILAPTLGGDGLVYDTNNGILNLFAGFGLEFSGTGAVQIDFDGIAGPGLGAETNSLRVNAGTHISVASDDVSVTVSSMAGSGIGVSGELLKVNTGDAIEIVNDLVRVRASDLVGPGLSSVGNNLEVRTGFTTDLVNNAIEVDTTHDFAWTGIHTHSANLASAGAVSGVTGWTLFPNGNADFRDIQADSLTVDAFIADVNLALAGSEYITKSGATVAETFTAPQTTGTLVVFDHLADSQVFESGDSVALRYVNVGTGLEVGWVHGIVTNYTDLDEGKQSWTFNRVSGSVGVEIPAGVWAIDYGTSGDGIIKSTVNDLESPYIDIQTWTGVAHLSSSFETHLRLGKLSGISDTYLTPTGFGLYSDNAYLRGELALGNGEVILDEGGLSMGGFYQPPGLPNTPEKITWYTDNDNREYKNAVSIIEGYRNGLVTSGGTIQTNFTNIRSNAGYIGGESTGADIAQVFLSASWFDAGGGSGGEDSASLRLSGEENDSEAFLSANLVRLGAETSSSVSVRGVAIYPEANLFTDIGKPDKRYRRLYVDEIIAGTTSTTDTGHNHDSRYYLRSEVDTELGGKSDIGHTHAGFATVSYVDTELGGKSAVDHDHDERYYTKTETDLMLGNLSAGSHNHNETYYTKSQIDTTLSGYALLNHGTHGGSGAISHSALSGIGADDHHNQQHDIAGSDHTGNLPWNRIDKTGAQISSLNGSLPWNRIDLTGADLGGLAGDLQWSNLDLTASDLNSVGGNLAWNRVSKTNSALTDLASRNHGGLTEIGANDHHNQQHSLSGSDHTGTLANAQAPQFALLDGTRSWTGHLRNDGSLDQDIGTALAPWRNIHVINLRATQLVPQDIMTTIDGRILVSISAKLTRDLENGDTTAYLDSGLLSNGTYAYLQDVQNGAPRFEAIQIASDATTITVNEEYSYAVIRKLDEADDNSIVSTFKSAGLDSITFADAGVLTDVFSSADATWKSGSGVVSLGKESGDGFIDISSSNALIGGEGPTISITNRNSNSAWNDISEVVALGNLESRLDFTEPTFGFAVGNNLNQSIERFKGLTATANEVRLINTPIEHYYNFNGVQTQGVFLGGDIGFPSLKMGIDTTKIKQGGFPNYGFEGEGLLIEPSAGQGGYLFWFGGSGPNDSYLRLNKYGNSARGLFETGGIFFQTEEPSRGATVRKDSQIRFQSDAEFGFKTPYTIKEHRYTASGYLLNIEADTSIADVHGIRLTGGNGDLTVHDGGASINGYLYVQRNDESTQAGIRIPSFNESAPALDVSGRISIWGNVDNASIEIGNISALNAYGPHVDIGYNDNNSTPAPGYLKLTNNEGGAVYLWLDSNREIRRGDFAPTSGTELSSGEVIA